MAQMLREDFSSEKHLDLGDRHIRLCQRSPGSMTLVRDIQPFVETLHSAELAKKAKEKEITFAYDVVLYFDGSLDNEVYNLFEACKKYDRESGSVPILTNVFPTGRISDVKDAQVMEEPKYVKELVERVKAFGSNHTLGTFIPVLESKITESDYAIVTYDKLKKELAFLELQEEIAQRNLRDQYRLNYLHAEELLGKKQAELLFPVVRKSRSPQSEEPVTQPSREA